MREEKELPPTTWPHAPRDLTENPGLHAAKIMALKAEGKTSNSVKIEDPTKKMTPKQKAAHEKAQSAIAASSDSREAARIKREKEQEEQK